MLVKQGAITSIIPPVAIIPAVIAGARQVTGRNPAIGAALFHIALAVAILLHIDPLATTQRIEEALMGGWARPHIDVAGGIGLGSGRCASGGHKRQDGEAVCHEFLAQSYS